MAGMRAPRAENLSLRLTTPGPNGAGDKMEGESSTTAAFQWPPPSKTEYTQPASPAGVISVRQERASRLGTAEERRTADLYGNRDNGVIPAPLSNSAFAGEYL